MFVKVEPTGICERKGLVQVRFCMYLDPNDYGYDVHHIQMPVIPEGGYPDVVDETGIPKDMKDYQKWIDALSRVWQTNPFHNHFIYVAPDTSDNKIMDIGEAFLHEAYMKWVNNEKLDLKNPEVRFPTTFNRAEIDAKIQHLKNFSLERRA